MAATVREPIVLIVFGCTNWQPKVHYFWAQNKKNGLTKYKIRNMVTLDVYESNYSQDNAARER